MTDRAALVRLAGLAGIETRYTDALGQTREASDETLLALIDAHSHEPPVRLPVASRPAWEHAGRVPEQVIAWAAKVGVPAPSARQWRRLSPLQRFALLKLSLPGHDNDNFVPALREFGLLDS